MGKDGIGWACMVAVASILLARDGFTGVEPIFSDAPDADGIENLGTRYELFSLYFKPYAACRWAQPAIAGALHIARTHQVSPGDIASVQVRTFKAAAALSRCHPANTEEAQYNLPFPVAAALIDSEVGPRQVLPPRIHDPAIIELADKVTVEVDEEFERAFPRQDLCRGDRADQRRPGVRLGRMEPIWEPPATLPTDPELQDKFVRLVSPVLGDDRARELLRTAWNFDEIDDARRLIELCIL